MTLVIRPMTLADVDAATHVMHAAFVDLDRREGQPPVTMTDDIFERQSRRHRHFIEHDPDGSWVALEDDRVIGSALALKRGSLWGLSLLVVDPATQSSGVGRTLLDTSLRYAEDCDRAIIMSSTDARALRAYATSGFSLYPQVQGVGEIAAAALPAADPRVRLASLDDVELGDAVDLAVRGAPRGPDHVLLAERHTMFVADAAAGQGYAYVRDGEVACLAATNEGIATALLWRCFAHAVELGRPATVPNIDAVQQWAIGACFGARLKVTPGGPVFWRGIAPPRAYLASGAYL